MTTRRDFLKGIVHGSATGLLVPRLATAETTNHNLIWITCFGGWDATRALIPAFDSTLVNMEALSQPMQFGSLNLVDNPERPSVRSFFERYSDISTVVHGVLTPSVAHEACLKLLRTGGLGDKPDWATLLASEVFPAVPIPHMVLSGPSFTGDLGHLVSRTSTGTSVQSLINGTVSQQSDVYVEAASSRIRLAEQQMRQRRLNQLIERSNQDPIALQMLEQFEQNMQSAKMLQSKADVISWSSDGSFLGDCLTAVDLLREGVSPCVSIEHPALWDSHSSNDIFQQWLWEDLFFGLEELCTALKQTQTTTGNLLSNTTIVVASDMGRAPTLNSSQGKDHWPYSSVLVISNAIEGQRSIGGYDDGFQGQSVVNSVGETQLTSDLFGRSLLSLWGLDQLNGERSIFDV